MDRTDVCNLALDMLREASIRSFDDRGPVEEWFQRNYDAALVSVFRSYSWNFAIKRAVLTANAEAPAFGWSFRYRIPIDCTRVLPLRQGGYLNGGPIPHEIEGVYILTNDPGPLKLRYISAVDDPNYWDALFLRAFTAHLALSLAHWLTGKASMVQIAQAAFETALAEARRADGMEGTAETIDGDDVISARYRS